MLALLVLLFAVYLLGAIPFGYVIGRLVGGIDLRQQGSGNIGATNVGRVLGWQWFPVVMLLDFAKGALPVALLRFGVLRVDEAHLSATQAASLAGLVAILGHLFPVYLGFKGGKGVATGAGVIGVLLPLPTLAAAAGFLITLALTRYVSLSSIVAALTLVAAAALEPLLGNPASARADAAAPALLAFVGAILVIVRHRGNVARLLAGTEPKLGAKPASRRQSTEASNRAMPPEE
jgi:glycerol-3-phosphate acyltransferase PlsY